MKVKHDADGHDEKDAGELVRIGWRLVVVGMKNVIRFEH